MKELEIKEIRKLIIVVAISFALINLHQPYIINYSDSSTIENLRSADSDIEINTPENIAYSAPMSGYYPATYGFECDADGNNPTEWTVREASGITTQVISELGGHKNVIEIHDNTNTNNADVHNVISRTSGTVEFWVRVAQNDGMFTYITDGTYNGIHFYFREDGDFTYFDGKFHNIEAYNINQWYHIKIEFDTTDWHLWIDNIQKDAGGVFILWFSIIFYKGRIFLMDSRNGIFIY